MLGRPSVRVTVFTLSVLALVASAVRAEASVANYLVRGPGGAVVWGLGNQPGTEVVAFAFSNLAPVEGNVPPPGPRVTFSVTHWASVGGGFVRRQWYGDAALKPDALKIGADLTETTLVAEVMGTLEERSTSGVTVRRDVPGRLEVRWTPSGDRASITTNFIHQTPPYVVTLQAAGAGRMADTAATVTVEALGSGPIDVVGLGTLLAPTNGTLVIVTQ
jgi:hypothetical protein